MATRPGPLRDIPLDHERLKLHSDGHISSLFKSPGKRPPSPSSYAICSPAKRRLIEQQTRSNAASGSRHSSSPHQAQVQAILHGPNSPARKLDFGVVTSSVHSGGESAHRTRSVVRRLADPPVPSPLLPSFESSGIPAIAGSSPLAAGLGTFPLDVEMDDHDFNPQTPPPITSRAREAHSKHYPHFEVYKDPQYLSASHLLPSAAVLPSALSGTTDDEDEAEADKENIRPARPAKLCFGEAAWAKAGLLCPREVEMLCSPLRTPSLPCQSNHIDPMEEHNHDAGDDNGEQPMNISPRAPRRMRDIANINVQPTEPCGKMALTSSSFFVLHGDKEKALERTRKRSDDGEHGMMDVENEFEGGKTEFERRG
ncbi:hypothetical protein EIP86_009565 [Pleurotus ostreatoroseus]|nr:hypothetical protein EIP86_009565 [Pleurotus ostreatoroseus]